MKVEKKDLFKIKRIVLKDEEVIGVLFPDEPNRYFDFIIKTISGASSYVSEKEILSIGIVRNIPVDVREIVEIMIKEQRLLMKKEEELRFIKEELSDEIFDTKSTLIKINEELRETYFREYGLYDSSTFEKEVGRHLSGLSKDDFYNDVSFYNNNLRISICLESTKYAREGQYGLVYQEYDGSMSFYNDEDKLKSLVESLYKSRTRKTLKETEKRFEKEMKKNKIKGRIYGDIDMGNKNTLILSLKISIKTKDTSTETLDKIKDIIGMVL